MKKAALYLSILFVVLIGGYIAYDKFFVNSTTNQNPIINNNENQGAFNSGNSAGSEQINTTGQGSSGSSGGSTTGSTTTGGMGSGMGSGMGGQMGMYKNGTYTGSVVDVDYGPVQVKVTIQGGKITDIAFLQYPDSSGHTREVSDFSLPILKSEAIQAQSANVDVVSGATQTSEGFIKSLDSALTQAS